MSLNKFYFYLLNSVKSLDIEIFVIYIVEQSKINEKSIISKKFEFDKKKAKFRITKILVPCSCLSHK